MQKLIDASPDVKIDIVAHSLGGLVAAYWATQRDEEFLKKHIHSIITLDSPLDGHPFASLRALGWVCEIGQPSVDDIDTAFGDNTVVDAIVFEDVNGSNILTSRVNFVHVRSSFINDLLPGY